MLLFKKRNIMPKSPEGPISSEEATTINPSAQQETIPAKSPVPPEMIKLYREDPRALENMLQMFSNYLTQETIQKILEQCRQAAYPYEITATL